MKGIPSDIFDKPDHVLKQKMLEADDPKTTLYVICSDILKMRHTDRLAKRTWWLALATWVLSIATILTVIIEKYFVKSL